MLHLDQFIFISINLKYKEMKFLHNIKFYNPGLYHGGTSCGASPETVSQTKSCIKQLLRYCLDAEYVPLIYASSEDNSRFQHFMHFFSALCKKLNIMSTIYEIQNFPYGPLVQLQSDRSAAMYWLDCTVQKTEFLLGIVTANPPVCTHLLVL